MMTDKALLEMIRKAGEFQKLPQKIVQLYMEEDGTDMKSAIRDLITDLYHLAESKELDVQKISKGALEVYKEEIWKFEQAQNVMIRVEVDSDGKTYLTKVKSALGVSIHFPMTDEGISDLKVELEDYGIEEPRILEVIENDIVFAQLYERVRI